MLIVCFFFAYKKLAQFAVRCALPPRRSESPVWETDNKSSCVLHLLGWGLLGRAVFPPWNEGPNFGSYNSFSSKEQEVSFNFMAAVTICSDLRAQINEVSHCFFYILKRKRQWGTKVKRQNREGDAVGKLSERVFSLAKYLPGNGQPSEGVC